jgi:TP901 family phage tail tape measure protein
MAAITLDIGANTRQAEKDIQKLVSRSYNINLNTKGDQPLGRITGKVNEFSKSLDASNARVIAFGASAGIIFGLERAFTALVSSTIEVQKSLQDINVILNVSAQNLQKFGAELFSIARNTGQSFQEVAKAATEFSRQGLGVEETLKRTNEALILSRLSGLDTAKSVEALTAAVNSFASQAVTATEIVNKFANVDAAFAVSSADLADAIARVGSSAAQSGVSLNELIAIVTSAQQTTARGGAVIGNSFKTIFTRLQRGKVVDLLESLGISGTDSSGQVKSTIQLLTELGTVYDTLGSQQQAYVAEQVGGVFQINILKAALADLGKEYSIYSSALNVAAGSTDQAIRRNEELNKTYASQINALQENARQLAAAGGERLLGPSIDRLVGGTNALLSGFNESDGQNVGTVLGKGILDGIGQFIAGPGLALIGGVLLKLFRDLAKFATGSVQQLLGLNTAATQQRDLQTSIQQILSKNPKLIELALKGEQGLNAAANSLLASLRQQTVELQKQAQVAQQISKAFISQAGVRMAGGVPVVPAAKTSKPGKAGGYIPNFSAEVFNAREFGASRNVRETKNIGTIGGKPFQPNNEEIQIPNMFGTGDTGVIPTYGNGEKEAAKMIARGESGSVLDKSDRNRAKGFIPNFAYAYKMKTFAGEGVKNPRAEKQFNKFFNKGGFSNVEIDDKINTVGFKIQQIPLTPKLQELYNTQPGSPTFTKEFEDYAIKRLGFINAGAAKSGNVKLYGGTSSAVDGYRISNGLAEFLEVKGGSFETLSVANKFGRVLPENLARFTQSQLGIQYLNALFKEGIPKERDTVKLKNTLAVPQVPKARRGNFNRPFKVADIEANRARNFGRAGGFIPNFAQTKEPSTQLGNLDKIPNKLGNKVLSLIYPGISEGYTLRPATASYLKKQYTGNIPVAGISQKKLQSQLPDIDKNIGNLLVKEANQFGQALGGFNFLKSPEELPNYGAAKGAVGVAFEGGVQTLLQQKVGKQNAGIDFRNITPRLRSVFNNAPGVYDAKRSPDLTNEVLQKLLNETKPGAIVQKSSGKAGAAYLKQRSAAVEQLRKEGVTGSVAIRQALKDRFGIVGKAAGYIPNFAAIQDAVNREQDAGIPKNQIYLAQDNALKKSNPAGLGVFNKLQEPNKKTRKDAMRRKGFAKGYVPNFAIEDPDVQATNAGTAISAVVAQLGFLAFSLQGSREQYKQSLEELTKTNVAQAKINTKNIREQVSQTVTQPDFSQYAGPEKGKEFGDLRRSRSPEEQAKRDAAAQELKKSRAEQKMAARGTKGQQFAAAGQAGGFALSIGAPIIAETIKNSIGQETAGARRTGEAVGAAGQIASFAGAGAMFGPWGAAIGAATGALLTVPGVIAGLVTDFPELQKSANKAAQEVTQFGESSSRLLQASEAYADVLSNAMAGPEALDNAQKALAEALNAVPAEYRNQLAEAAGTGKISEVSAQIQAELLDKANVKAGSAQLGKSTGEARFSGLKQNAARALDFSALNVINKVINRDLSSNISDQFDPKNVLKGQENVDAIQTVVTQSLTGGEFTPEVVKALEKIPLIATSKQLGGTEGVQTTGAANEFVTEVKNVDDLRKFLESTGQFDPSNIGDFLAQAEQDFEGTVSRINESIATTRNEASSTVEALAKATAKQKEYLDNVKKASDAIDAASSSLEKNVAIQNLFKTAFENLQENVRSFSQNLKIEQTLTRPREVLGSLIGEDKDPTRRLAAQEGLANIRETERSGIAGIGLEFKGTVRDILQKPFQENINKLRENLGQTKEGFKGDSDQIGTQTTDIINQTTTEYQKLNSVMQSVEGYMSQFVSGQISTQQLLEQSRAELSGVGIDVSRGSQASDAIEKAVAELEVKSTQEQLKAFQQRAKLASETKQAILQDKINQALGTFGGFEGFMNRPNEEENYIQKIEKDFDAARSIRGSADFRYNVPGFANKARDEKAPDLGRAFSGIYKQLIDQSGGAFRGFIQQEIDSGSQLSGTSGGRISKTGGFDDIVRGRKVDIEQQLKLAKDQLKIETDPVLKRTLEGFVKSIESMPGGTEGIATLQTQKEFGVARQSDFQKLFNQYDVAAFDALSKVSPELAASLASATALTDDPLLNEASAQTAVQSEILKTIRGLSGQESGMITPIDLEAYANEKDPAKRAAMKAGYASSGVTPIDLEAYAKEKDPAKRAAMKAEYASGYASTGVKPMDLDAYANEKDPNKRLAMMQEQKSKLLLKKEELDKKLGIIPQQTLPKDNRTIAEIEAETRAKRDQKYLTSPLAPLNRTTGQKFENVQQVDSEMTKALALGAINPEQKEYFNVLKNFKQNLNPVGGASGRKAMFMYDDMNPQVTQPRINQALQSNQQPAAAAQQSFTQQEAAFNNNTSALTSLAGGLESLNSTLANFEANFGNLNNVPGAQPAGAQGQAGTQPNITTTTNAPVNVTVNAESDVDIATSVAEAVQKAIPTIINQVRAALGPPFNKVPPQVPKP